jgi:hypothetical protein
VGESLYETRIARPPQLPVAGSNGYRHAPGRRLPEQTPRVTEIVLVEDSRPNRGSVTASSLTARKRVPPAPSSQPMGTVLQARPRLQSQYSYESQSSKFSASSIYSYTSSRPTVSSLSYASTESSFPSVSSMRSSLPSVPGSLDSRTTLQSRPRPPQQYPTAIVLPPHRIPQDPQTYKAVHVLILTWDYHDLPGLDKENADIRRAFEAFGYSVKEFHIPIRGAAPKTLERVKRWVRHRERGPDNLLIVYYNGHGVLYQGELIFVR